MMVKTMIRRFIRAAFMAYAEHAGSLADVVLSTRVIHAWILEHYPRRCPSMNQLAMVLRRMPGVVAVGGNRRRTSPADSRVTLWRLTS